MIRIVYGNIERFPTYVPEEVRQGQKGTLAFATCTLFDYIPGIPRTRGLALHCFSRSCFLLEMAEKLSSTSESDFESVNYEYEALTSASIGINPSVDVITVCQKVLYTIPSFPVITVELRLVKVSLVDGTTNHFHVFMREDEELDDCVPANIEMIETCTVDVSPSSSSLSLSLSGL